MTKKIIEFLCSESGSHDYTINRREAKDLGLVTETPSDALYTLLEDWTGSVRSELELSVPFDTGALLGVNQTATYKCVRCLIESTAADGRMFVSEGTLKKISIQHPTLGQQEGTADNRTFEGWRAR